MTGVYIHGPDSDVMVRALMICAGQRHIEAQVCMANVTFVFRNPLSDLAVIGRYGKSRRADATQPHAIEAALARAERGEPIVMGSVAAPNTATCERLTAIGVAFFSLATQNWDAVYARCKEILDITEPDADVLLNTEPSTYGLP